MTRRVPLLVALGLVVVIVGWYVALWSPQHSALKSARAAQSTATATQAQLSSELGRLRALQRTLPADAAALQRSLPALPVAASIDTIIDQITQVAGSSGVAWTNESQAVGDTPASGTAAAAPSGSAAGATASSGTSTVAMTLTVSGSYRSVASFISSLGLMPRLFVIDRLQYSPSSSTVSANISGRAFYDPTPVPVIPVAAALASSGG